MSPRDACGPRILVVDDERAMAEMLADGLADRGYQATALASGEEAALRLRDEAYDALVTDLRMPHVDGLALLAEALEYFNAGAAAERGSECAGNRDGSAAV